MICNDKTLKIPTAGSPYPGDKVLDGFRVLYHGGHRVATPLAVEGVGLEVVVRQALHKVQGKHRRHPRKGGVRFINLF